MMEGVFIKPEVYAVKHIDEDIRKNSRSGGVFTVLSDFVLENSGVIYGCVLTEEFIAVHIRSDSTDLRNRMRGSKYIQSELGDTLLNVKKDLENGKYVLFSGTSCQIDGLKGFLGKDYEKLLCVDIVCHGVPSKKVWLAYLKWQEKKTRKRVVAVDFRNKKDYGWRAHVETLTMEDGSKVNSEVFKTLFYNHSILRPCCYQCPYKDIIHPGDITIADYWGIEKAAPEFEDDIGVSLVLINTEKGKRWFKETQKGVIWEKTKLEDSMQPPLRVPFSSPQIRETFWIDFQHNEFGYVAKNYGNYSLLNNIKGKLRNVKRYLKKVIKNDRSKQ